MIVAAASRDTLIISKTFLDGGLQYGEVPGTQTCNGVHLID